MTSNTYSAREEWLNCAVHVVGIVASLVALPVLVGAVALLFLVHDAEASADVVIDTTWGAYLFLAVPYLVGAFLLAITDRRALWVVGAAVQVVVVTLFVLFGVGVMSPENEGVFDYDELVRMVPQALLTGYVNPAPPEDAKAS